MVDLVQFFTGAAAAKAAAEDGSTNVPPPNDYWIRNGNRRLRELDVMADARVTVNVFGAEESGNTNQDIPWTLTKLAAVEGLADGLFWVTVRDGEVVRIAEQYLP